MKSVERIINFVNTTPYSWVFLGFVKISEFLSKTDEVRFVVYVKHLWSVSFE